jgi:hypothetical protein
MGIFINRTAGRNSLADFGIWSSLLHVLFAFLHILVDLLKGGWWAVHRALLVCCHRVYYVSDDVQRAIYMLPHI